MSASNESAQVTLNIATGDGSAEVFVIDGRFNLAGRGVGAYLTFQLDPGLYRVKVIVGTVIREEQLALHPSSPPVLKQFAPVLFASPAPLAGTAKTHEFHVVAAVNHSRHVHIDAGRGSWIFVCARGWSEKVRTDHTAGDHPHPARGLKLLDEHGVQVADLEERSEKDLGWEPWAVCNVSVVPGNYRLQLEVPSLERTLEQAVVASPGWQTQIFLLQRDYAQDTQDVSQRGRSDLRADLLGAAVLMSGRGYPDDQPPPDFNFASPPGFDPGRSDLRLAEAARLALSNRRKILSREMRDMLRYKFENPMLGIFGAHLLLLEKERDVELFRVVLTNLRKMVGHKHPDVEALALKLNEQTDFRCETPPMLQRSWSLICEATTERPELVAEDSLLAQLAQRRWGNSIWLTWVTPEPEGRLESAQDADELSDLEEAILVQLKAARRGESRAKLRSTSNARFMSSRPKREEPGSSEARAVKLMGQVDASLDTPDDSASSVDESWSDVRGISSEAIKKLTHQLGVPRAAVEKSIKALQEKDLNK